MTTMSCFWIVWSPGGQTTPRVRHASRQEAERVTREMAARYPGHEFYACRVDYRACLPVQVTEQRFDVTADGPGFYDPDLPF